MAGVRKVWGSLALRMVLRHVDGSNDGVDDPRAGRQSEGERECKSGTMMPAHCADGSPSGSSEGNLFSLSGSVSEQRSCR